jgi:hypothetical protein
VKGKLPELKPDRTSVLDGKLRTAFRDMASGKFKETQSSRMNEVRNAALERRTVITDRNTSTKPSK